MKQVKARKEVQGYFIKRRDVCNRRTKSPMKAAIKTVTFKPLVNASPTASRDKVVMGDRFNMVLMLTPASKSKE